ncbi:hypothetical protein FA13DRAFT_1789878 [Coprinellus micaceus]|uniref:Uncharacterized protein n=1 Tax=Coprinellus micaceus TaxID=71717 RepID=A0A4Y7TGX5_COPMI|nr:hypothetical protein FA13DRAFT_1789878 [Coprinellus micaceus]
MPRFKGYSVWVEVEGKKLPEFDPEFFCDDIPLIVCYVPCEAGKKFRIGCTFPMAEIKKENHVSSIAVDGRDLSLECSVLHKNPRRDCYSGRRIPSWEPFTVKIETYAESTAVKRKKRPKPNTAPPSDGRIHETKTNVTHFVKYGEEQSYQEPKGTFRYELFDTETLCEFKFLYRGLDMLIAKDLAPRHDRPAVYPPPPLGSGPNLQAARVDPAVQPPVVPVPACLGEGNPTIPASSTSIQTESLRSWEEEEAQAD